MIVNRIIQEEDNPVNFMESLKVNVEKGSTEIMRSDLAIFEKPITSWVKREIKIFRREARLISWRNENVYLCFTPNNSKS